MMIKRILKIILTMAHQQQHQQQLQNYRHINGHHFFNLNRAVQSSGSAFIFQLNCDFFYQ